MNPGWSGGALCTEPWQALRGDVMRSLLDPPVANLRWRVLSDLVGRPFDSPAVRRSRSGSNIVEPVATLLAELQPDGAWSTGVSAWTPFAGPGWRLLAAIAWGADPEDPRMAAGAQRLLQEAVGEGGFAPRTGQAPSPCLTARALQGFAALGLCRDPRFEEALAWLEEAPGGTGWGCCRKTHRGAGGCAVTAVAVLATMVSCESSRRRALKHRAVAALLEILREAGRGARLSRCGHPNLLATDLVETMRVLARAGVAYDAVMRPALRAVQSAQNDNGWWVLRRPVPSSLRAPAKHVEAVGQPSPWITLNAATAVMRYAVEAGLPRLFPAKPTSE